MTAAYHALVRRTSCATLSDVETEFPSSPRSSFGQGVVIAIVALISFGAGLSLGSTGTTAAVISRIPLIGDGLDATPDQSADLTDFWKAWNALNSNYVITQASSTLPASKEKIFGAIKGLASSFNDPYTVFLPPEEAKSFAESISGSFAGVGMEIGIKNDILTVIAPLKGTPAEVAGIKPGDLIISIDGNSTEGLSVEAAVSKIRGPAGTVVALRLVRDSKPLEIEITRAQIRVPETEDGYDAASGVYHIALYEFTANSASAFDAALSRFRASGSDKLVIDLRGNPGGYLDAAVDMASHFLPKGAPIVTEDFDGKDENQVHTSAGYADVPSQTDIAVLLDQGSASASEILAGALQDAKVATVIGTRSFGKGSVQTLIDLGGGALKVTVARWITPSGHWIMGNGITPDIVASSTPDAVRGGKDPQMERAIRFLSTGK